MDPLSENGYQQEESFLKVAKENSISFCSTFLKYKDVHSFLHRSEGGFISTRCVNATFGEIYCLMQSNLDIDGVVLEMKALTAIKFPVFYMNLLPRGDGSIISMYPILKKHIDITQYQRTSFSLLKMCNGIQLFSSFGWQVNLALIPLPNIDSSFDLPSALNYKLFANQYFNRVKSTFQNNLLKLSPKELCKDTFKKNSIFDVSKWRVLAKDQSFVMAILDKTLIACQAPPHHRISIVAFRFGERDSVQIQLATDFCLELVTSLTTHIAVTFKSIDDKIHFFWSRDGIQKLVGFRGSLLPVLSFRDCCNFQTNLDGRPNDISDELRNVCMHPNNLRFLQLYADSPHMHCSAKHPLSGLIATCNLLHPKSTAHLSRLCDDYLSVCRENCHKLGEAMPMRLEVVVSLDDIPSVLIAKEIINLEHLELLMDKYPMVVPFQETVIYCGQRLSFISFIKKIAELIFHTLVKLKEENNGLGKMLPSWEAYQYELCNEMLWWGKLNSYTDAILSRNLGPGDGKNNRSVTFEYGFLCLESSSDCALDESSPPPLHHWTTLKSQIERIQRLFSFGDFLSCNDIILGTRVVLLLIEDIKYSRDESHMIPSLTHDLRQASVPSWASCILSVSAEQLCKDLSRADIFHFPFTFGRALEMMKGEKKDIANILLAGLNHLNVKYFPCYRIKRGFKWTNWQVLKILYGDLFAETNTYDVKLLTANIINEMEKENLVFRSKFINANAEFPWVFETCQRLRGLELGQENLLRVLTFVTCVCLIQNGYYVNFSSLLAYVKELPITQQELQMLKVLSVFFLRGPMAKRIYRIYEDIPHKFDCSKPFEKSGTDIEENEIENANLPLEVPVVEKEPEEQNIQHVPARHVPARLFLPWNTFEMNILHDIIRKGKNSYQIMYKDYVNECKRRGIPDRTFNAFRAALLRAAKRKE